MSEKKRLNDGVVRKAKSRNPKIEFDRLQLFFGEPYVIDLPDTEGTITLLSPSIGDLIRIGEKRFYQTLNIFTSNTTTYRLPLWNAGIDWNEMSDFELFASLCAGIDQEVCDVLVKDIDFTKFQRASKSDGENSSMILYDYENGIEINELVYHHISQYFRTMFNSFPEEKITNSPILKQWYIDKDKRQKVIDEENEKKGKSQQSYSILPLVSSYINHPGTKYKSKELKEVSVYEFFDSINRISIYESATACMKGLYSGFVDGKKIKPESYNFMRDTQK